MLFSNLMQNRLPSGRAWKGKGFVGIFEALGKQIENQTNFVIKESKLYNNFAINYYESWRYVFNLPHETDNDRRYQNVVNRFRDSGGQSANYIESELNQAGFDVSVTANFNPTEDLSTYIGTRIYLGLNEPEAYLGANEAYLGSGASNFRADLIVNYVDELKDSIYNDLLFLTQIENRWKYGFFIHAKGGKRTDRAQIPASRKDDFRRLVIQLKNFGTWAFCAVQYQ